jgi:hypothetical protein
LDWITEEQDIFRWAKYEDLDLVASIALTSFHWNLSKTELIELWVQKIGKNIIAVVEQNGDIKGFVEVLSKSFSWEIIYYKNIFLKVREKIARLFLCNKGFSNHGTYLLYIATKKEFTTIGLGARMINVFKKYNNKLSVLCLKTDLKIIKYYLELGFKQSKIPLNFFYRFFIEKKYLYLEYKSTN